MTMLTKEREAEIRSEVAALCGCGALERMGKDLLAEVDALRDERDELALMLFDILDGVSRPHDIEHSTGLPIERCKQISKWFSERRKRNG